MASCTGGIGAAARTGGGSGGDGEASGPDRSLAGCAWLTGATGAAFSG